MANKLNDKQKAFCDHLLTDAAMNATQAYKKAYPDSSDQAAKTSASDLLTNPNVKAYLDERKAERSKPVSYTHLTLPTIYSV